MNPKLNRRELIAASLAAGTAAAIPVGADARTIAGEVPWAPGEADRPDAAAGGAYRFLSADEVGFIDAAVGRLIPTDDLGPGAREAGATVFIDRQLAGAYGAAQTWYMQGPWADGSAGQGYQSRMTPAELYRAAIKAIDEHCRSALGGKAFRELGEAQQDELLAHLEKGEVDLGPVPAKTFFELLLQNTVEGFFSDPIHGGNRDMVGWKMIGFPGARYDYRPYVKQHNQRLALPPVGIMGRPGWAPAKS